MGTTTARHAAATQPRPARRRWAGTRRAVGAALAVLVAGLPSGCVAEGRPPDVAGADVVSAIQEAASGVATAELAASMLSAGTLARATADTALLDSVRVLEDATAALATLVPPDDATAGARDDALGEVHDGTALVVETRAWAAAHGGPDPADGERLVTALGEAAAGLERLATSLEEASS